MSSRPQLKPYKVIVAQSMASSVFSQPTIITNTTKVGYDISWSGGDDSTGGTFQVQVSNTYSQNAAGGTGNAGDWTALTLSSVPTVASASGNGFIEIDSIAAYAIRLVYLQSGGSGVLNATIVCKVS